jgi:hypothetical protein
MVNFEALINNQLAMDPYSVCWCIQKGISRLQPISHQDNALDQLN